MLEKSLSAAQDVWVEVNGVRLAGVERCRCQTERQLRLVEELDGGEPRRVQTGQVRHTLELVRPVGADSIRFYPLSDFDVAVCRPDGRVIYTGCAWNTITETAAPDGSLIELVSLTAAHRMELMTP